MPTCRPILTTSLLLGTLLGIPARLLADACGVAIAEAARAQIGVTASYDPSYRAIGYPRGDVPASTGVCSDVLIRAWRAVGLDLQQLVHEDMLRDFGSYPNNWGLRRPDRNIDHRRVANLERFLERAGLQQTSSHDPARYEPGDVVTWRLSSGLPHVGLVAAERIDGRPLIVHNIGMGAQLEDVLFAWPVHRHFRLGHQLAGHASCEAPAPADR